MNQGTSNIIAKDGHKFNAYYSDPIQTQENKCGIIVIQEVFGVNSHIRSVCDKFAKKGYFAVAPALFDRISPNIELGYTEQDLKQGLDIMQKFDWNKMLLDLEATNEFFSKNDITKTAIVGYCFGGTVAWKGATELNLFKAAVGYYGGGIASNIDKPTNCPVMLHFGTRDPYIPISDIEKIRGAHPEVEIYTYDAGHGFNCDQRKSYAPESAELAYERTLSFFKKYLG